MKLLLSILFSANLITSAQNGFVSQQILKGIDTVNFSLYYGFSGLGSNMGSFQPTIRIIGTELTYTYEQNSYYGEKSKRIDTVGMWIFRQSSIDSIAEIVKDLRDTTIEEYNFCIMSGGIHFLSVTIRGETTRFQLSNTFDYSALKIANILNKYLPQDKQLWANEKMIKDAEDCLASLMKTVQDNRKH